MDFLQKLDPNWISAVASAVTALSVALAFWQLVLAKKIAQSQFEDALSKEYRELASRIPTKALLGKGLTPKEYSDTFDELFRYIDLSNEQVALRKSRRISQKTWKNWSSGIQANLELPVFKRVWKQVREETRSFQELRRVHEEEFEFDPACWNTKDRLNHLKISQ